MDKDLLFIEFIFFLSLIINVFIQNHLSVKLLFIVLLFLYILKSKPNYVYNKSKFLFVSYGLVVFSVLFLLLNYITSFYFILFMFCLLVLFLYLKYILFRFSYGVVVKKNNQQITINIKDAFYRKKITTLNTRKQVKKGDVVIFSLKNLFLQKSSQKVISIIKK